MAPETQLFKMPFPSENQDPHYEALVEFFNQIDSNLFATYAQHQPVAGGGEIQLHALNSTTTRLTWTEDFEYPILRTGKVMKLRFGPDGATRQIDLIEGDRIVFDLFTSASDDVVQNLYKLNGAISSEVAAIPYVYTLAIFKNSQLYSKLNGTAGYTGGDLKVTGKLSTLGSLGVGTDFPSQKLDVAGESGEAVSLSLSAKDQAGAAHPVVLTATANGGFSVSIDGQPNVARFTQAGMGLGTSPAVKLDVADEDSSLVAQFSSGSQASPGTSVTAAVRNTSVYGYTSLAIDRKTQARSATVRFSTADVADWFIGTLYAAGQSSGTFGIGRANQLSTASILVDGSGNVSMGGLPAAGVNLKSQKGLGGSSSPVGIEQSGTVQSDATVAAASFNSVLKTASSVAVPSFSHFIAQEGTLGSGSTVSVQAGFRASASLINGGTNYGFLGEIPSGQNRWNLYMSGGAANYLNGSLGVGVASPQSKLHVASTSAAGDVAVKVGNLSNQVGSSASVALAVSSEGTVTGMVSGVRDSQTSTHLELKTLGPDGLAERMRVDGDGLTLPADSLIQASSGSLGFVTDGSVRLKIDSAGSIGINADPTGAPLSVAGDGIGGQGVIEVQSSTTTGVRLVPAAGGYGLYLGAASSNSGAISAGAYSDNGSTFRAGNASASSVSLESGAISLRADSNLTVGADFTPTERLRVTSSGVSVLGSITAPIRTLSASGSVLSTDSTVLLNATSGSITATLPTAVGIAGRIYTIKRAGLASGAVATTGGQTIDGASSFALPDRWSFLTVQSDGSNWLVISTNVIAKIDGGIS